jgi:rubrerythrin
MNALKEIADEELVPVGEFLRLLRELAPDEEKFYAKGAKEGEGKIKKGNKGFLRQRRASGSRKNPSGRWFNRQFRKGMTL